MPTRHLTVGALALTLSVVGVAVFAHGTAHEQHAAAMNQPVEAAKSADIDLRDRTLVDQDDRQVKFVSDVIGDRIVVMDFVFTSCTNVCPILSAVLSQVQQTLGDRLGDEVVMVSVTVDPIRDTPQRLKAYAAKHRAGAGWTWLTGPKPTVDDVLIGLGAYAVNFEDHPSMVLVGDGRSGEWSRFFGFPSPDRIMEQVDELQATRKVAAPG
jgi:protein SCO1/2